MVVKNMKMYIKCRVCLCIGLFFCTYIVNNIVSSEFMEIHSKFNFRIFVLCHFIYTYVMSDFVINVMIYGFWLVKHLKTLKGER